MSSSPITVPPPPLTHVAIIMDGNGRWAKSRGLPRIEGHRRGVENIREVLEAARELQIKHITLFAFSVENWQRPAEEISALMGLLEWFLNRHLKQLVEQEIRLRVIGRPDALPDQVRAKLDEALQATRHFTRHQLNVALNYGSRTEVLDAVRHYLEAVKEGREDPQNLDWATFTRFLQTDGIPDPDLLIRTSGETRISNFLLLQCAYSELYFSPVNWPDFDKKAFFAAVEAYQKRQRRFGRTAEQVQAIPAQSNPSSL